MTAREVPAIVVGNTAVSEPAPARGHGGVGVGSGVGVNSHDVVVMLGNDGHDRDLLVRQSRMILVGEAVQTKHHRDMVPAGGPTPSRTGKMSSAEQAVARCGTPFPSSICIRFRSSRRRSPYDVELSSDLESGPVQPLRQGHLTDLEVVGVLRQRLIVVPAARHRVRRRRRTFEVRCRDSNTVPGGPTRGRNRRDLSAHPPRAT